MDTLKILEPNGEVWPAFKSPINFVPYDAEDDEACHQASANACQWLKNRTDTLASDIEAAQYEARSYTDTARSETLSDVSLMRDELLSNIDANNIATAGRIDQVQTQIQKQAGFVQFSCTSTPIVVDTAFHDSWRNTELPEITIDDLEPGELVLATAIVEVIKLYSVNDVMLQLRIDSKSTDATIIHTQNDVCGLHSEWINNDTYRLTSIDSHCTYKMHAVARIDNTISRLVLVLRMFLLHTTLTDPHYRFQFENMAVYTQRARAMPLSPTVP